MDLENYKRDISNKGLDISEKREIIPLCPLDLSRVYTSEGALSRTFSVAELNVCSKIHLHLRTYVGYYGGYAEHGRYILFGLNDSGKCCVKLTPIKSLIDTDPIITQKYSWFINNPAFNIKKSIYLCIAGPGWAQSKFLPENRYTIMWTMIESLHIHNDIAIWLSNVNEIWVPTTIDKNRIGIFVDLNKKTRIMKLGYDNILYNEFIEPMSISSLKGRYVFGVLGSWNKRKGTRKIIRAFCKAFSSKDNVSLLLICKYGTRPYNGIKDGEDVRKEDNVWNIPYEFKRYTEDLRRDLPHITLIDIPIHECVLPHIMKRFNCLVGFSMGESTWLPGLQAFGMKIPVIQLESGCSGFIDYMNHTNSYLCRDFKYEMADDELVEGTSEYYEGQQFANGNEDELADMMKKIYRDKESEELKKICSEAYVESHNWWWKDSVNKVVSRLEEIRDYVERI